MWANIVAHHNRPRKHIDLEDMCHSNSAQCHTAVHIWYSWNGHQAGNRSHHPGMDTQTGTPSSHRPEWPSWRLSAGWLLSGCPSWSHPQQSNHCSRGSPHQGPHSRDSLSLHLHLGHSPSRSSPTSGPEASRRLWLHQVLVCSYL